jgi:hypothetical protein
VNKNLVVSCMNETMHSFRLKGQKNFSVYLQSPVLTMQLLSVQGHRQVKCVLLALANGTRAQAHIVPLPASSKPQARVVCTCKLLQAMLF